jgi:hypothetical protein
MGWDFDFSIPSQYFPYVYVDENNNVVHTSDGAAAYDAVINSINVADGVLKLTSELAASQRQRATNYIGRYFDSSAHAWVTVVTNYPGNGNPANVGANWDTTGADANTSADFSVGDVTTHHLDTFPWMGYPGQGLQSPTGPIHDGSGYSAANAIVKKRVIGMAVYRPAAQLGQEYGAMETDRGKTRGKFTELVFDVKHDAWVIPQFSHGILLIVDSTANTGTPSLKVEIVQPAVLALNYTSTAPVAADMDASNEDNFQLTWDMDGVGNYDNRVTFATDNAGIATVSAEGLVHAVGIGTAGITITSVANPDCHDFINIPVQA